MEGEGGESRLCDGVTMARDGEGVVVVEGARAQGVEEGEGLAGRRKKRTEEKKDSLGLDAVYHSH